jgi:hypothetical protein
MIRHNRILFEYRIIRIPSGFRRSSILYNMPLLPTYTVNFYSPWRSRCTLDPPPP